MNRLKEIKRQKQIEKIDRLLGVAAVAVMYVYALYMEIWAIGLAASGYAVQSVGAILEGCGLAWVGMQLLKERR